VPSPTPRQTAKGTSDETWAWDGKVWKALAPAHKPPARRSAGMAYDPAHQVVILYGGLVPDQAEGHDASDTWAWDGTDWTEREAGPGPTGQRDGPALVTAGDRVVLFGGRFYNEAYFGDAWAWDGMAWHRIDKDPQPPGRANAAVTWNPVESSLSIFGGNGFNSTAGPGAQGLPLGDAWSLTGSGWQENKASGPPTLSFANAIWDGGRKRPVVFLGISCPRPSGDAWAWDGHTWSKSATGIPPRWGAAVAQSTDGKALFGGSDQPGC
jgi:hypothetical protein